MNNNGYIYEIHHDAQGIFFEISKTTGRRGEVGELHLSVFVNTPEGETPEEAFKNAKEELNDPVHCMVYNVSRNEVARQRAALDWLIEAYPSIKEMKGLA